MDAITQIILLLDVLMFYTFKSVCEAGYFHIRSLTSVKLPYEHHLLVIVRCGFWLLFLMYTESVWYLLGIILIFPFIHDGVYYTFRNILNPFIYAKRFWDDSTTSTAVFEIKLPLRKIMFVIGLVCIWIYFFKNI